LRPGRPHRLQQGHAGLRHDHLPDPWLL